jgi:hypothetical protein
MVDSLSVGKRLGHGAAVTAGADLVGADRSDIVRAMTVPVGLGALVPRVVLFGDSNPTG